MKIIDFFFLGIKWIELITITQGLKLITKFVIKLALLINLF